MNSWQSDIGGKIRTIDTDTENNLQENNNY